jgi:hypothetical protein
MSWILVLFVHAGMMSDKDSMAITNVPGFKTEAACLAAGRQSEALVKRTSKEVKFVCVKQE